MATVGKSRNPTMQAAMRGAGIVSIGQPVPTPAPAPARQPPKKRKTASKAAASRKKAGKR